MKAIRRLLYIPGFIVFLGACSKMDDYRDHYTDGKEKVYTGKADSVKVYPGKNRLKLQWLYVADPKVTKARVFWNGHRDSLTVNVARTAGVDTVRLVVDKLEEGNYNFEIISYDADGNASVKVAAQGVVYGDNYQASLLNRPIRTAETKQGFAEVNWFNADQQALYTEVRFKKVDGNTEQRKLLPGMDSLQLFGYLAGTKFDYRTLYLPDSAAIDTFVTAWQQKGITADVSNIYLSNAGFPFTAAVMANGRFGTLAGWITNDAAKNIGGQGGFDNYPGYGTMGFEYWGTPAINNGKIYQVVSLPAGKYKLQATIQDIVFELPAAYLVATAGASLPNAADYAQSLGYAKFTNSSLNNKTLEADFTLAIPSTVSLGVVVNMVSGNQNLRIRGIRLYSVAD